MATSESGRTFRAVRAVRTSRFEGIPFKEEEIIHPVVMRLEIDSNSLMDIFTKNNNGFYKLYNGTYYTLKDAPQIHYHLTFRVADDGLAAVARVYATSLGDPDIIGDIEVCGYLILGNEDQKYVDANGTTIIYDFAANFEKFLVNGCLVIKMEGSFKFKARMAIETLKFSSQNPLGEMLFNRDDKDFEIVAENKIIKVHKFILEEASDDFVGRQSPLNVVGYDFEVLQMAIKSMYRLCLEDTSMQNKCALLKFFHQYRMHQQKSILERHLIKYLAAFNVCELANCSVDANAVNLEEACIKFITNCFNVQSVTGNGQLKNEFLQKFLTYNLCAKSVD